MGRIVFKQYFLKLHGKQYDILIPDRLPENMWMVPRSFIYKYSEGSELLGDRDTARWLRNTYITLALEPDKIIYFPLKENHPVCPRINVHHATQVVFYNHNVQFERREWKDIKHCLRYCKGKPYVVHYNADDLEQACKEMEHQWKKSSSYYSTRRFKEFYQYETCFFETCRKTALQIAAGMQKELKKDLDDEAEHSYLQYAYWLGPHCKDSHFCTGFFYVNRKNYKNMYYYDEIEQ